MQDSLGVCSFLEAIFYPDLLLNPTLSLFFPGDNRSAFEFPSLLLTSKHTRPFLLLLLAVLPTGIFRGHSLGWPGNHRASQLAMSFFMTCFNDPLYLW